jgi:TatD DNase family protein
MDDYEEVYATLEAPLKRVAELKAAEAEAASPAGQETYRPPPPADEGEYLAPGPEDEILDLGLPTEEEMADFLGDPSNPTGPGAEPMEDDDSGPPGLEEIGADLEEDMPEEEFVEEIPRGSSPPPQPLSNVVTSTSSVITPLTENLGLLSTSMETMAVTDVSDEASRVVTFTYAVTVVQQAVPLTTTSGMSSPSASASDIPPLFALGFPDAASTPRPHPVITDPHDVPSHTSPLRPPPGFGFADPSPVQDPTFQHPEPTPRAVDDQDPCTVTGPPKHHGGARPKVSTGQRSDRHCAVDIPEEPLQSSPSSRNVSHKHRSRSRRRKPSAAQSVPPRGASPGPWWEQPAQSQHRLSSPPNRIPFATPAAPTRFVPSGQGKGRRTQRSRAKRREADQVGSAVTVEAQVARPSKADKDNSTHCPVCQKIIEKDMIREHVSREHLPWFLSPGRACWECKEFVIGHFGFQHFTCTGNMPSNTIFREWILLVNGLLWFLVRMFDLPDIRALLTLVQDHMPQFSRSTCQLSMEQLVEFRLWELANEEAFGLTPLEGMTITPPNCVACLLHWRPMSFLVANMTLNEREEFRWCRERRFWNGRPAAPNQVHEVYLPMATIDSHLHPDMIQVETNVTNLMELRHLYLEGDEEISIVGLVGNFVFPDRWHLASAFHHHAPRMVYTFGVHPHVCARAVVSRQDIDFLWRSLQLDNCRALGEVGLDYHSHHSEQEQANQRQSLKQLLPLAVQFQKRVVIHCRDQEGRTTAFEDCLAILKQYLPAKHTIHWHCFTGTRQQVRTLLVTFPNTYFGITAKGLQFSGKVALDYSYAVRAIPLDRILLESDSPLLLPPGRHSRDRTRRTSSRRHRRINHPWLLVDVAQAVSQWRGCAPCVVLLAARLNAAKVYNPL